MPKSTYPPEHATKGISYGNEGFASAKGLGVPVHQFIRIRSVDRERSFTDLAPNSKRVAPYESPMPTRNALWQTFRESLDLLDGKIPPLSPSRKKTIITCIRPPVFFHQIEFLKKKYRWSTFSELDVERDPLAIYRTISRGTAPYHT